MYDKLTVIRTHRIQKKPTLFQRRLHRLFFPASLTGKTADIPFSFPEESGLSFPGSLVKYIISWRFFVNNDNFVKNRRF